MNPDRDLDHLLDRWFADGPREVANRVVLEVAERIERQPQLPAWRLPWRHVQMNPKIRWLAAAAAVLMVAVVAGAKLFGSSSNVGPPGPSPTQIATASPMPSATSRIVEATKFRVPLTLTLSGDWTLGTDEPSNLELFWRGPEHVDLAFHPLDMVLLFGATVADPLVPVPADFAAWLRQRPEFSAVTARAVSIGGRPGTEVDAAFVWTAGTLERNFLTYSTGGWRYDQGDEGHRVRFIVVPGPAGEGFIIVMNAPGADFDPAAAELDTVLATVQFHPAGASIVDPAGAGSDIPAAVVGTYSEGDPSALPVGDLGYSWALLPAGDAKCVQLVHVTTSCIVITRLPSEIEQYGPAAVVGDLIYYRMIIHNFQSDPCLNKTSVWRFSILTDRLTMQQLDPGCRNTLDDAGFLLRTS
jgi:hypothetical protein